VLQDAAVGSVQRHEVEVPARSTSGREISLQGTLSVTPRAKGLVVFAHGSGSSRASPRNVQVADTLNAAGLATLLFDLLTDEEAFDRRNVFDVALLGRRLLAATAWLREAGEASDLPIAYFGASTGAAAALWAAAEPGAAVWAIVSRGGRPDLAGERLGLVTAPTLLIVGGEDRQVLTLNREAARLLVAEHDLSVVPGATHLFEEPGALEQVARLATEWFVRYVTGETP
jgi:putative phosphoribosyl transferase